RLSPLAGASSPRQWSGGGSGTSLSSGLAPSSCSCCGFSPSRFVAASPAVAVRRADSGGARSNGTEDPVDTVSTPGQDSRAAHDRDRNRPPGERPGGSHVLFPAPATCATGSRRIPDPSEKGALDGPAESAKPHPALPGCPLRRGDAQDGRVLRGQGQNPPRGGLPRAHLVRGLPRVRPA